MAFIFGLQFCIRHALLWRDEEFSRNVIAWRGGVLPIGYSGERDAEVNQKIEKVPWKHRRSLLSNFPFLKVGTRSGSLPSVTWPSGGA
jgi:hypothetical protein